MRVGSTDNDGYGPMQAAAKPAGCSSSSPAKKSERKDDGESRSPKSRRHGDAKKHGAVGLEGKKSGPRKPKQHNRANTVSVDGQGAPSRKKGGSKNPLRGPVRKRSNNLRNSCHAAKPAR